MSSATRPSQPELAMPALAQAADRLAPDPDRPLIVRLGKRLRGAFDTLIAHFSLIPNDAVLDMRDFPWTAALRANWRGILAEARSSALAEGAAPPLAEVSPDHRAIAHPREWRCFFLWGYGYRIDENADRCPETARLVEAIPGLASAFFSILSPGSHVPAHRGVTKGLVTCHLGLIVPRDGDTRMRLGDRVVRWAEGETLVFDDTHDHELWNDAGDTHVLLAIQFRRPLRQPGKWIADHLLDIIRRSPFVQEARANLTRWNAAAGRG